MEKGKERKGKENHFPSRKRCEPFQDRNGKEVGRVQRAEEREAEEERLQLLLLDQQLVTEELSSIPNSKHRTGMTSSVVFETLDKDI